MFLNSFLAGPRLSFSVERLPHSPPPRGAAGRPLSFERRTGCTAGSPHDSSVALTRILSVRDSVTTASPTFSCSCDLADC